MNIDDCNKMDCTGERYVPGIQGNIELEHRHRYLLACELCHNKDVLDLASGEGYGSAMLSSVANSVVGVDIARDAVSHSQRIYARQNLRFMVGGCAEIPLPNASIDVVVSFEALEHHAQHDEMMVEVKRVLRPGGLLIISTPDKYRYSIAPGYTNQFHVKELYHHEFVELLHRHFANASLYGQRVIFGSFVVRKGENVKFATLGSGGKASASADEMSDPMYWIGVASDAPLPTFGAGFLEQPIEQSEAVLAYAGAVSQLNVKLAGQDQALSKRNIEIGTLRNALTACEDELTLLKQGLSESTEEISTLRSVLATRDREVSSLATTLSALRASTSWRITRPLRAARRLSARLHYSALGYPLALGSSVITSLSLAPLRDWRDERAIARSGLFDKDWYLRNNPDVAEWCINPIRHYVAFGAKEWRDPSPSFSTRSYLWHNPDVAAAAANALAHFAMHGVSEDRISHRGLNTPAQDRDLPSSSMPPYPAIHSPRTTNSFPLKLKHRLKGVLGPRMSANVSRMLARTRFGVRKFHNLKQTVAKADNSLDLYKEAYMDHAQRAIVGRASHYGSRTSKPPPTERCDVQLIAYYLPQYHPIPENDRWWGPGFTEWRNVARAFPVFAGHDQPRLPGELGYYDLRIPQVMRQQIELAKLYGISAFCFHFYWFGGKRLLELPIEAFLKTRDLDFKFCLCWANENWTRRWDGADQELLIAQSHSADDDVAFIRYLQRYFDDPRYLRIDGKPVLTVYRPSILPDAKATVKRWRAEAERAGFPGIYLIATNSFGFSQYQELGFDALSEFPPHGITAGRDSSIELLYPSYQGVVYSYPRMLDAIKAVSQTGEAAARTVFPGVMPGWDNTPRQPVKGNVFHGSTPNVFYEWLTYSIARARKNRRDERKVFINAWNEWAEGAYLEPDRKCGYAYLAACAAAVSDNTRVDQRVAALFGQQREHFKATHRRAIVIHLYYEDLAGWFADKLADFGNADVYITVPHSISWEAAQAVRDNFSSAYILEVDNRGRDIRPFLVIYSRFLEGGYDFVCKLHSKKSPHLTEGDRWRVDMVTKLLGPEGIDALTEYHSKPSIGILAPRGSLESLADRNIRLRSENNLLNLTRRLNCELTFRESFVAGSMFWFRPSALQNLHELFMQGLEFEPELGQVDGTIAHAIERIVCIAAKAAGMSTREFGERISRASQWA